MVWGTQKLTNFRKLLSQIDTQVHFFNMMICVNIRKLPPSAFSLQTVCDPLRGSHCHIYRHLSRFILNIFLKFVNFWVPQTIFYNRVNQKILLILCENIGSYLLCVYGCCCMTFVPYFYWFPQIVNISKNQSARMCAMKQRLSSTVVFILGILFVAVSNSYFRIYCVYYWSRWPSVITFRYCLF